MIDKKLYSRRSFFTGGAKTSAVIFATAAMPQYAIAALAKDTTKKNAYFKYHTKPAAVIDFGLSKEQEARALALHKSLLVFDGEFEVTWHDNIIDNVLAGGGSGGSFTVGVAGLSKFQGKEKDLLVKREDWWAEHTLFQDIGCLQQLEREQPERLKLCYKADDFREAKRDGKVGLMMDVQNSTSIGNDPSKLDTYYKLGIRRAQLTYNFNVPA